MRKKDNKRNNVANIHKEQKHLFKYSKHSTLYKKALLQKTMHFIQKKMKVPRKIKILTMWQIFTLCETLFLSSYYWSPIFKLYVKAICIILEWQ